MKENKTVPLYRQRRRKMKTKMEIPAPETSGPMLMREAVALPGIGLSIPVRAAKAKFSALLELVAGGQEVTITSDGKPKARLVRAAAGPRKVFTGMGDFLQSMPVQTEGPLADEIIRADRDGRGW